MQQIYDRFIFLLVPYKYKISDYSIVYVNISWVISITSIVFPFTTMPCVDPIVMWYVNRFTAEGVNMFSFWLNVFFSNTAIPDNWSESMLHVLIIAHFTLVW